LNIRTALTVWKEQTQQRVTDDPEFGLSIRSIHFVYKNRRSDRFTNFPAVFLTSLFKSQLKISCIIVV